MKVPSWGKKDPQKWERLVFNRNYLKKIEEENGGLHCEYCGTPNLIVYEWYETPNRINMATVDHFYPKSKYEELTLNEDNFIVACDPCNSKKSDDLWDLDRIKYPIYENKINTLTKLNYVRI